MSINRIISVIGLGYVGLTTAIEFSRKTKVIAFDIDLTRIEELKNGEDRNDEVSDLSLESHNIIFTTDPNDLKEADFHIITVPTPLRKNRNPNFTMIISATKMLGEVLKCGDIVVYESSVFPGATDEICVPLLEKTSNLKCGKNFSVGFSPERINPADKQHTFSNIVKVVSASDNKALEIIADTYKSVVKAGVFPVSSMAAAESCKIIENTQRDVNIAFMNDVAIMLHALNISTAEVISAMETKWNYVPFRPGLIGGHCIGVNSYYLLHKLQEVGYYSELISASRRLNESISNFIVLETIKNLIKLDVSIKRARVGILGMTYKENCSDVRDTKVIDIINGLKSFGLTTFIHDPIANDKKVKKEYDIDITAWEDLNDLDAIVLAVAHKKYQNLSAEEMENKLTKRGLIMDVKNIFNSEQFNKTEITLWKL